MIVCFLFVGNQQSLEFWSVVETGLVCVQQHYSVLMSVYYKEKPANLRMAMDSIWKQTLKTDDFVLVCDGPLNDGLDCVIQDMERKYPDFLHVVRLKKNVGLGNALNIGLKYCKNNFVARMDSDDISRSYRCEKQIAVFLRQPEISIVSGTVEEFTDDPKVVDTKRVLPENQKDIIEFAKQRNPFNHPCVMYKKDVVEAVGNYQDFYLLEDYYLWVRMLQKGFIGYNIQEPLLWMRAGSDMYKRRSGLKYARSQNRLFYYMKRTGFITNLQFLCSITTRVIVSLVPNGIRKLLFKSIVRKSI